MNDIKIETHTVSLSAKASYKESGYQITDKCRIFDVENRTNGKMLSITK